jgi:hypothetical protein
VQEIQNEAFDIRKASEARSMFLNNLWENKTFKKNLATNLSCVEEEAAAWRVSTFYFRRRQRKYQQY